MGRVYLVTEWIRGGELYNHITQGGPLREIHAAPLFKQLLLAVKHMVSLSMNGNFHFKLLTHECRNKQINSALYAEAKIVIFNVEQGNLSKNEHAIG